MERRERPITELRIKKTPRARGASGRGKRVSDPRTEISASASGTQPVEEHGVPGFQPWLKGNEYEPRVGIGQPRRNKGRKTAAETRTVRSRGLEAAQHEAETRAARVEELQARVAAGTYEIDSEAIARIMLGLRPSQE